VMTSTVVMAPVLCLRTEAASAISRDGGRRCPSEAYVQEASGLYEPIDTCNPFGPHIGIADGPFEHLTLIVMKMPWPFTSRMTVAQLASGDLFLHSPIAFDVPLEAHLQALGRVRCLVSPTRDHYAHIGEWAGRFWTPPPGPRLASASERALSRSTCNSTAISIASPALPSARVFLGPLSTLRVLP
jgi:hypothetical protein